MSTPTLSMIPTTKIAAGDDNPRGKVDTTSEAFAELCASIKAGGILQPILVGPANGDGKHTIVAGHRRHAAAKKAKLAEIPAMVLDLEGQELLAALTENIQREDLSPVAEAQAIHQLRERHGFTQVQAGEALSKSERWVRERLRLLRLPEKTQEAYDAGALPLESLVPVEKVAKQAPKVAEALAAAAAEDEGVRKAVGADRVPDALDQLIVDAAEDLNEDGTSKLGCFVFAGDRHRRANVTFEALALAGPPAEQLQEVKGALAEFKALEKELKKLESWAWCRKPDPMQLMPADVDAANSFGCLLSIDGSRYITDAAWLADRFLQEAQEAIKEIKAKIKQKASTKSQKKTEKGSPEEEKAAKEERKRQREAEEQAKAEARAANLELGQRAEKALRSPKLSLEEGKLLALLAVGRHAEGLGARGLVYCYHDYQDEQQLNNGRTKVTYTPGKSAGEDLIAAIKGAKRAEDALGIAARAVLLASFASEEVVAPSNRSGFDVGQIVGYHRKAEVQALISAIAEKRAVLPDAVREAQEEQRRLATEADELALLYNVASSKAKDGIARDALTDDWIPQAVVDAAVAAKWLKANAKGELSYTITAAGKKRLEKLKTVEKERQAA